MHTYFLFNILVIYLNYFGAFLIVFLSLPLLLFMLVVSMAPKRKSTPTWNPLHFGASSSSDSAPLSLQFRDDDAYKAYSENFSRWGVHLEHQVILADFADTDLPTVIHSREWESLCDVSVTCPLVHARDWSFNTSFLHSCLRYVYSCHIAVCYGCTSGS